VIRRIVLALTALSFLTACAAGPNAVTLKEYTPTDGNQVRSGDIKVVNLLVIAQSGGTGTVIGTILNSGDVEDALEGMTVNGQPVTITADSLALLRGKPLIFGGESATATGTVSLTGVKAGQFVPVAMKFAESGLLESNILIREETLEFTP
jgi:hypothetical protein